MPTTDSDCPAEPTTVPRFRAPERRADDRGGMRRPPPTPVALRVLFWCDLLITAALTVASIGRFVIVGAPIVVLAFSYVEMGRKALWARAALAGVLGAVVAGQVALAIVNGNLLSPGALVCAAVLLWQGVAAAACVQALHLWSRKERERARDIARVRPLPAGRRHWRGGPRTDAAGNRHGVLTVVAALDGAIALAGVVAFVVALSYSTNLRDPSRSPLVLALSFPALFLARMCWDQTAWALRARPWFWGAAALLATPVAGVGHWVPWTLAAYCALTSVALATWPDAGSGDALAGDEVAGDEPTSA